MGVIGVKIPIKYPSEDARWVVECTQPEFKGEVLARDRKLDSAA